MANSNKGATTMILKLALVLLVVSVAESRKIDESGSVKAALVCSSVVGAEAGDTCSSIAQAFNLPSAVFAGLNPNINCNKIFIGQWICVDGSTS